jgi:hypothetical protein
MLSLEMEALHLNWMPGRSIYWCGVSNDASSHPPLLLVLLPRGVNQN